MVEPVTLGAIVAVLVSKALGRVEDKALDQGEGVLRRVVDRLRQWFSGEQEGAGELAVERLEDAPDSPQRMRDLAQLLDERADAIPEFRRELESLVAEARSAGVDIESVTQVAIGNQIVQNAGITDSEVTVTFGGPGASRTPQSTD